MDMSRVVYGEDSPRMDTGVASSFGLPGRMLLSTRGGPRLFESPLSILLRAHPEASLGHSLPTVTLFDFSGKLNKSFKRTIWNGWTQGGEGLDVASGEQTVVP